MIPSLKEFLYSWGNQGWSGGRRQRKYSMIRTLSKWRGDYETTQELGKVESSMFCGPGVVGLLEVMDF